MKWRLFFGLPALLVLAGCGGQIKTLSVLPGEYEISASPPAGMYGGWAAISPDFDAFTKEASARCPNGYKLVNQETGNGLFVSDYLRWDILCRPLPYEGVQAP
jgi:hypothetical protein